MAPVRTVGLADTSLRALSTIAPPARASVGSLLGVLGTLDKAGYRSVDAWGDMTFDHSLRVLGESPWERLRALVTHLGDTPLRLHLRGRCLLGFRPYSWGVVDEFLAQATDCGVRSFLLFEPLNDLAALERMAATVRDTGASLALALVHGGRYGEKEETVEAARRLGRLQPDAFCLKTAGALGPKTAADLITALREAVPQILEVDFDNGSGLAAPAAAAAVVAGADVVHCSSAPVGVDPSGVPVSQLVPLLLDAGFAPEVDPDLLREAGESLATVLTPGCAVPSADINTARAAADFRSLADVPGDLFRQVGERLSARAAMARLGEVIAEIQRIRAEIGWPVLVPPIGQVVATQAVLNVMYGARWQVVPDEMKAFLRGEYGMPPAPPAPEIMQAVMGRSSAEVDAAPATTAFSLAEFRDALGDLASLPGDALLQALAPEAARAFLQKRLAAQRVDLPGAASIDASSDSDWEGEWHELGPDKVRELIALVEASTVDEVTVENEGTRVTVRRSSTTGGDARATGQAGSAPTTSPDEGPETSDQKEGRVVITASMVGTFYRSPAPGIDPFVQAGRHVDKGDVLCVLEAMKLMNEMVAELAGTIASVLVDDGTPVEYGQPLFLLDRDD